MTYVVKPGAPGATNPAANSYVADLGFAADVAKDGNVNIVFKALQDTAGDDVVPGQPMSVGAKSAGPWGQNVVPAGAGDIEGLDYLGQPMIETMVDTASSRGTYVYHQASQQMQPYHEGHRLSQYLDQ
jgi:hypothetical protein